MYDIRLLRLLVLAALATVILLTGYTVLYLSPSYHQLIVVNTEREAIRLGKHLAKMILNPVTLIEGVECGWEEIKKEGLANDLKQSIQMASKDFGLMKVKLFAPDGEIVYSSSPEEIGQINEKDYFHHRVAKGEVFTKMVQKDSRSLEEQIVRVDVVETYVPIMDGGRFLGAFELYYDVTESNARLARLVSRTHTMLFAIGIVLLVVIVIVYLRARKSILARARAEQKIIEQSLSLKEKAGELSVLYDVSKVISSTIDLESLLKKVLDTIVERLKIFEIERRGGIFLINGKDMELVTHLGHPDAFLDLHKNMTTDICLCGLAARTGEIIISTNSDHDDRHSIRYCGMAPHGHIIVPLKTVNRIVGILYLYVPAETEIDDHITGLLDGIGNQVGIAIENAKNYEKNKALSLHDPLTGLANRRLLEANLKQNLSLAERYGTPLSFLMLDIDFFKKYNDTYGHNAGDEQLLKVARIIAGEVRDSDLASRYGGEEFFVILPEANLSGARSVAERIRRRIEGDTNVTISCGISEYGKAMEMTSVIEATDSALYLAKDKGRNRVECLSETKSVDGDTSEETGA